MNKLRTASSVLHDLWCEIMDVDIDDDKSSILNLIENKIKRQDKRHIELFNQEEKQFKEDTANMMKRMKEAGV